MFLGYKFYDRIFYVLGVDSSLRDAHFEDFYAHFEVCGGRFEFWGAYFKFRSGRGSKT